MNTLEMAINEQLEANKPEISMAPLIDVVFLLLIFFVVATVFPDDTGLVINKPETETSQPLSAKNITFYIKANNEVYYQNGRVHYTDIKRLVVDELSVRPETGVVLKVDKQATTESMIKVMDACKQAGAHHVGIATNAITP